MYVTVTLMGAESVDDVWTVATVAIENTPGMSAEAVVTLLRAAADSMDAGQFESYEGGEWDADE